MTENTAGVLFCGAGGGVLGMERAGYDVTFAVDYDEDAIATVRENFDSVRAICADLTSSSPDNFVAENDLDADVDCLLGGPPCQGFSLANENRGEADYRNNLVFVFAEYVRDIRPDVFLMENVPGLVSGDMRDTFDYLIDRLASCGYEIDWKIHNAADFGVPQSRRRVIVQGRLDGRVTWAEPSHGDEEEWNGTGDVLDLPTSHRHKGGGRTSNAAWRSCDEPSHTITAATNNVVECSGEWRWWTREELKTLQTFPDDYTFVGNQGSVGTQIGNAAPPLLIEKIAEEF